MQKAASLVHKVKVNTFIVETCRNILWYLLNLHPLDSFCLSLQLEVLHSQTLMLIRERWGDLVQVERYHAGKCLSLSVWK